TVHGASLLLQTLWGKKDTCSSRDEPLHLPVDRGFPPFPRATCLRLCDGRLLRHGGPALPGARPPRGYAAGRSLPHAGTGSPLAWGRGQIEQGGRMSEPRSSAWGYPKQGWPAKVSPGPARKLEPRQRRGLSIAKVLDRVPLRGERFDE